MFQVYKINGRLDKNSITYTPYGGQITIKSEGSKRAVPAGNPITLTISGGDIYTSDGVALADMMSGKSNKYVSGDVTFTPKPNKVYRVNGMAAKTSSSVWVEEESSGRLVTSKVTKN